MQILTKNAGNDTKNSFANEAIPVLDVEPPGPPNAHQNKHRQGTSFNQRNNQGELGPTGIMAHMKPLSITGRQKLNKVRLESEAKENLD